MQRQRLLRYRSTHPIGARWLLPLTAIAALLLIPVTTVRADVGPKPTMEFAFKFEIDPVSIVDAQLIECEDAECTTGEPLQEAGPQGIRCTKDACSSTAYGYAPYHKLVIEFSDRTRESNIFNKKSFAAKYTVTVSETDLTVKEKASLGMLCCCPGLLPTLVAETLIALVYVRAFRLPQALMGWVPLASLLTLPIVWLAVPTLALPFGLALGLAEIFAVVFEAGFMHLVTRKIVPLKHVALLSLGMNVLSFGIGLLLHL